MQNLSVDTKSPKTSVLSFYTSRNLEMVITEWSNEGLNKMIAENWRAWQGTVLVVKLIATEDI